MKKLLLYLLLLSHFNLAAQKRKQQIEILNKSFDSLNTVLTNERINFVTKKAYLESVIQDQKTQIALKSEKISDLQDTLILRKQQSDKQNIEIARMSDLLQLKEQEVIAKQQEIAQLKKQYYIDHLIDEKQKSVGEFKIGQIIPNTSSFILKEGEREGEGGIFPFVDVYQGKEKILTLYFRYESKTYEYTNIIDQIIVWSDIFKTEKGIGVNTTIDDFATSHSDYSVQYSYISGRFWLETQSPNSERIQFDLNSADYIDNGKELTLDDGVTLNKSDFKSSSKIISVRIY